MTDFIERLSPWLTKYNANVHQSEMIMNERSEIVIRAGNLEDLLNMSRVVFEYIFESFC